MTVQADPGAGILVGTSGYSYGEWVDAGFYPEGTHSANMLNLYAGIFPATELNYTWYQMPRAPAIDRMCARVPIGFRFTAKLTRTLTHEIDPDSWQLHAEAYRKGISPLLQSGRLLSILIQFPPGFKRTPGRRRYLAALLDELADLPLSVEFRHASWACDRVLAGLEKRKVTLVTVDTPGLPYLFPAMDAVTNPDLFYIRFHGRNARGWNSGSMQHQFDYDYSDPELGEWVTRFIKPMAMKTKAGAVFFNNHVRGQAPKNALRLTEMLIEAGCIKKPDHDTRRHSPEHH